MCHDGVCVSTIRVCVSFIRGCVCIFHQGVSCGCVCVCVMRECDNSLLVCYLFLDPMMISNFVFVGADG